MYIQGATPISAKAKGNEGQAKLVQNRRGVQSSLLWFSLIDETQYILIQCDYNSSIKNCMFFNKIYGLICLVVRISYLQHSQGASVHLNVKSRDIDYTFASSDPLTTENQMLNEAAIQNVELCYIDTPSRPYLLANKRINFFFPFRHRRYCHAKLGSQFE